MRLVRGWILCALLGGTGCDVLFGLDRVGGLPVDAAHADGDGDAGPASCDGGHDEDGDGVPDACDTCPGIPDDQTDSDEDGVGDACDPSPLAANEIVLFASFADDNTWTPVSGNWTRDGENLIYDAPSFDMYGTVLYSAQPPAPPYVVEYAFSVDNIPDLGSGVRVILDANAAGQGVTCGFQRHESPIRDVVRITFAEGGISSETDIGAITTSRSYRVTATYDREQVRCVLTPIGASGGNTTILALSQKPTAGTFGFASMRVGMKLHYVAIYKER